MACGAGGECLSPPPSAFSFLLFLPSTPAQHKNHANIVHEHAVQRNQYEAHTQLAYFDFKPHLHYIPSRNKISTSAHCQLDTMALTLLIFSLKQIEFTWYSMDTTMKKVGDKGTAGMCPWLSAITIAWDPIECTTVSY